MGISRESEGLRQRHTGREGVGCCVGCTVRLVPVRSSLWFEAVEA